jgi:hypothetical protein
VSHEFEIRSGSDRDKGAFDPVPATPRPADPRPCATDRELRDEPYSSRLRASQQTWGHSFADLLGNPALVGCNSLGLCPAGRYADASISAAQLGDWMVQTTDGVVLLVEADLWRPGLASLLGAPTGPGLADALLSQDISIEEVVHQTRIPRLNLLPAGKPVQGKARRTVAASFGFHFNRLCGRFPNVIVALPSATDPECASFPFSVPNAVLLVVQPQQTSVRDIQWASRRLREAGAALVGTVMDEPHVGALARA